MKTIASQIHTSLLITVIVVLGGWGYFDLQSTVRVEQESLQRDLRNSSERLAYNLAYPLWNLNLLEVEKSIEYEVIGDKIQAILVYDESGALYAGKIRESVSEKETKTYNSGTTLPRQLLAQQEKSITREIIGGGKPIGKIVLYGNDEHLRSMIRQQKIKLVLKLLGIIAALSFVQFYILRKVVIQPLTLLKGWVLSFEPDKPLPLPQLTRCEEIDTLTSSFSEMAERLSSSFTEINAKNAELEERENQLHDRNDELMATEEMLRVQIYEFEESQVLLAEEIVERKNAKIEIDKLNTQLEQRVKERTLQLEAAIMDLSHARDAANTASQAKSMFLANMSHEIRTPMNAVLGFAQLLERDPSLSPPARHKVNTILKSGDHLLAIINDILEMSRIEAGRVSVNTQAVDLHDLLEDLGVMFRMRAEGSGLLFTMEYLQDLPHYILADLGKLRQILINLLGNSVKFTKKGSISMRAYSAGIDRIAIEVQDTGIGITGEELKKLFRPFERTRSGEQVAGGTGLGLAISREYSHLMAGEITVTSQAGEGSCFRFEFHAPMSSIMPVSTETAHRATGLVPGQGELRVLVVDDQSINRELLREILEPLGFVVAEASDGREAIEKTHAWRPRIVLMDLVMPGMDGAEATRTLRSTYSKESLVIIGISASTFDKEKQQFLDAGLNAYIAKPFREQELLDSLTCHAQVAFEIEAYEDLSVVQQQTVLPTLCNMSSGWHEAFMEALSRNNITRIRKLGEEAQEKDPQLSSWLLERAGLYDLNSLKNLGEVIEKEAVCRD